MMQTNRSSYRYLPFRPECIRDSFPEEEGHSSAWVSTESLPQGLIARSRKGVREALSFLLPLLLFLPVLPLLLFIRILFSLFFLLLLFPFYSLSPFPLVTLFYFFLPFPLFFFSLHSHSIEYFFIHQLSLRPSFESRDLLDDGDFLGCIDDWLSIGVVHLDREWSGRLCVDRKR